MLSSTERFSSRVENYIRYRPRYPRAVMECLRANCGLTEAAIIADIGSGTGILTEMLLQNGNQVYGVEPNRSMREAGERQLQHHARFHSVNGTAEATTLANASVDFVTAGQAFHWFDRNAAKAEFRRILRHGGWVALIWNERRTDSTAFSRDYDALVHAFATDYEHVNHKQIDDSVMRTFFDSGFGTCTFENIQRFDVAGLKGRLLSSSYSPEPGDPRHAPMIAELEALFAAHQANGEVAIEYDANVYYGQVG